jgi:hypothetical protein
MFQTLKQIIYNINEDIKTIPSTAPVLIYMGVGTYAGLIDNNNINNGRILQESNYHQYPPFIKSLKNDIPDLHLYIILIDPLQENPPFMITDRKINEKFRNDDGDDKFKSRDERITVYVLRKYVTTEVYMHNREVPDNTLNITHDLENLNRMCIENNYSFIYHDYCGRQIQPISEYFDSQLNKHLDRIIYGFNSREDTGCYFDMTNINSFMPYRIKFNRSRKTIKFFNIFKYIVTGKMYKIDMAPDHYDLKYIEMIIQQKLRIIKNITDNLKNYGLATLRAIYKKLDNDKELEIHPYHFHSISKDSKKILLDLLTNQDFYQIFEVLKVYYSKDIDIICKLKNFTISGRELLNMIMEEKNPYLWINGLQNYVSE